MESSIISNTLFSLVQVELGYSNYQQLLSQLDCGATLKLSYQRKAGRVARQEQRRAQGRRTELQVEREEQPQVEREEQPQEQPQDQG